MTAAKARLICGMAIAAGLAACTKPATGLDQGWSQQDINRWYSAYQGSRLLPEAWFYALEQPGGTARFLDKKYMASFGFLDRPGVLPVGFSIEHRDEGGFLSALLRGFSQPKPSGTPGTPGAPADEHWVGVTCAACHTADLRYGDHVMRVYGSSSLVDLQSFLAAFELALTQTRDDPARFDRFADRVMGAKATAAGKQALHQALDGLIAKLHKSATMNQTDLRYGYGRLDAIGYIYNKVALIAEPGEATGNPPDAPASYPFIWNTHQQTHIEWNGITVNRPYKIGSSQTFDVGALGRNLGEVMGVFGEVTAPRHPNDPYVSSVEISNLVSIEQQVMKLKPPRWPSDLFPVDRALAAEGKGLFASHCESCHAELPRGDLKTHYRGHEPLETMSELYPQPLGTDPWTACNAVLYKADTGLLNGTKDSTGQYFGPNARLSAMLTAEVVGVMSSQKLQIAKAALESFANIHSRPKVYRAARPLLVGLASAGPAAPQSDHDIRLNACEDYAASGHASELAYKARPLTGAWASGPYLHNGSVPTLYDLLLPPSQRPATFYVGTRQFDPKHVGFVTTPSAENSFEFDTRDKSGKTIDGNSNLGHDYGNAALTEHQRLALIEYMKIMGE